MQKIIHATAVYATATANQYLEKGWRYVTCYAYNAETRPDPRYGMDKTPHGGVPTQFEQKLVIVIEKKEDQ